MPTSAAPGHTARQVMQSWVTGGKRAESARKAARPSVDVATYPRRRVGRGTWDAHDDDRERGLSDVLDLRTGGRSGTRRGHRNACHCGTSECRSADIAGQGGAWAGILHDDFLRPELPGQGPPSVGE